MQKLKLRPLICIRGGYLMQEMAVVKKYKAVNQACNTVHR